MLWPADEETISIANSSKGQVGRATMFCDTRTIRDARPFVRAAVPSYDDADDIFPFCFIFLVYDILRADFQTPI